MSAISDIYDPESAVELSGKALFDAAQITCYIAGDNTEIQKKRPRVEFIAILGSWAGKEVKLVTGEGNTLEDCRESAWEIKLQLEVITEAKLQIHREYRAGIRNIMARFVPGVNGVSLLKHRILHPVASLGSTPVYKDHEGFYRTTMNYVAKISVQNDAWAALAGA